MNKPSPSPLPIATGTTASGAAMVVNVCLPGPITTVITVRDVVGSPVANASLSAVLPGGRTQPLGTTDASGRLTTPVLAPATLRASVGVFSGSLALSTLSCVTETKAAATVFVKAPSYTPKYRFPWQNPIHRATGGIYADRTKLLRTAVHLMCNVADQDAASLDHDACMDKLIAAWEAQSTATTAWAAKSTVGPDGTTQLAPIEIHADSPTFYEPWVWYAVFHFSGIRYHTAHGSYSPPSALIAALRAAEIKATWPDKATAAEDDLAEAMVLAPDVLDKRALASFSKDIAVAKSAASACAKVFSELKKTRAASLDDYAALGLLVARHALNPYPDPMWKTIVSHTQLRNDTDAADWSNTAATSTMAPYAAPMGAWRSSDDIAWKPAHLKTLDIVMPWVVCNQLSEVSAAARGTATRGGITGNAGQAAAITPLRHVTRDNFDQIGPGTHIFYLVWAAWDQQKSKEEPWATVYPLPLDWWLFDLESKCVDGVPASVDTLPEPSSLEGDAPMMINRIKIDDPANLNKVFVIPTLDQKNNQVARVATDKTTGSVTLYLLKWQHECVVIDSYTDNHGVFHYVTINTAADGGTGLKDHSFPKKIWTPEAVFGDVATTIDPNFEALRQTYLNASILRSARTP